MKTKIFIIQIIISVVLLSMVGCGNNTGKSDEGSITIVYTNDTHSYIDNVEKDEAGNVIGDGLRFSKIAAMVADMRAAGKNVILVDAGDEIQGNIYGAIDEGEKIIDIMNATGYQLATPGNHDFGYGITQFLKLVENADFPYITCNFHSMDGSNLKISDTKIFDIAGKKVAFVGILTPETFTSSTPAYFQNEKGEFIYSIDGTSNAKDLYDSVQNAIDSVRDKADYVIALGHLGVGLSEENAGISSKDVISNVSGLDAFIDGHSHTTMEGEIIKDKDGKKVLLTQTGNYLNAVGVMEISKKGKITTKLVNDYESEDENVAKLEEEWIQEISDRMSEVIGELDTPLYIANPDNEKERWIRAKEMNCGDFTADSVYWFFNDRLEQDCDVAIINGGGVRTQIDKGDVTYLSAKQVEPFGNMICLISAKGQQIIDALEMGVTEVGKWDEEWNCPAENGGFMHVAGLTYTVDCSIPSNVKVDGNGLFKSVDGEYRVKDVKIYNKSEGKYEDINPEKEYKLAGISYLLRNSGNGLSMFKDDELVVDYVGQDYIVLSEYIKSFNGKGDKAVINTKNSPLFAYKNYLLDYENPLGAGRINIINDSN